MGNGKWEIYNAPLLDTSGCFHESFIFCCPQGPRFRRVVAESA